MRNRKAGRGRVLGVGVALSAVAALALASVGSTSSAKPHATPNIVAQAKAKIAKYYVSKDAVGKPKSVPKPPKNQTTTEASEPKNENPPEASGDVEADSASSVPIPLLVLAGLALLLIAGGSAGYFIRRYQGRNNPPPAV